MSTLTEFISVSWLEAIGWTLIHSVWQGIVIAALATSMLALFRKQSPQFHYWIVLFCLFAMPLWAVITLASYAPLVVEGASAAENFSAATEWIGPIAFEWAEGNWASLISDSSPYLVSLWLIGCFFFSLRCTANLWYLRRIRSQQLKAVPEEWQQRFEQIKADVGIKRGIRLMQSALIDMPMVLGHLKPVILIPFGMLSGLQPQQVEAILIHELAHIRRNDYLINLLLAGIEILFFYHPVYWWMYQKLEELREHCCDDIAVSRCGNALLYAKALASLENQRLIQTRLALGFAGKKKHLLSRIQRVMMQDSTSGYSPQRTMIAVFLIFIGCALSYFSITKGKSYPEPLVRIIEDMWEEGEGTFTEFEAEAEFIELSEEEIEELIVPSPPEPIEPLALVELREALPLIPPVENLPVLVETDLRERFAELRELTAQMATLEIVKEREAIDEVERLRVEWKAEVKEIEALKQELELHIRDIFDEIRDEINEKDLDGEREARLRETYLRNLHEILKFQKEAVHESQQKVNERQENIVESLVLQREKLAHQKAHIAEELSRLEEGITRSQERANRRVEELRIKHEREIKIRERIREARERERERIHRQTEEIQRQLGVWMQEDGILVYPARSRKRVRVQVSGGAEHRKPLVLRVNGRKIEGAKAKRYLELLSKVGFPTDGSHDVVWEFAY